MDIFKIYSINNSKGAFSFLLQLQGVLQRGIKCKGFCLFFFVTIT